MHFQHFHTSTAKYVPIKHQSERNIDVNETKWCILSQAYGHKSGVTSLMGPLANVIGNTGCTTMYENKILNFDCVNEIDTVLARILRKE